MISIPVTPVMSDSTRSSLRFICVSDFCRCWMCCVPCSTNNARWRRYARNTQIDSSGRKAAANRPNVCHCCNHWQSCTSDFRPGTDLSLRGSTRITWNPRRSNSSNKGIQ